MNYINRNYFICAIQLYKSVFESKIFILFCNNMNCYLCNIKFDTNKSLRIHNMTNMHREKLNNLVEKLAKENKELRKLIKFRYSYFSFQIILNAIIRNKFYFTNI